MTAVLQVLWHNHFDTLMSIMTHVDQDLSDSKSGVQSVPHCDGIPHAHANSECTKEKCNFALAFRSCQIEIVSDPTVPVQNRNGTSRV